MKLPLLVTLTLMAAAITQAAGATKINATPYTTLGISGSHGAEMLSDGDLKTYFRASRANYAWCGLDLGDRYVVTSLKFAPASILTHVLGMFEGANNRDFSDAIPLQIITGNAQTGKLTELSVTCSRGVRYVRYVGPADSYGALAELEVWGDKGAGDDSRLWQITNLPTVIVNTVNAQEPYDKVNEIAGTITVIAENGSYILSEPGGIRLRGNASMAFPKKPYRLKFEKKQRILPDAPAKAKKWTLINNYGDKSLMRNMLAFDAAKAFKMEYVPFCQPVDVVLNGEYKGCYQLCDQVNVNKNRVNIDEMEPTDISGDNLTGGYFFEIDAYADQEPANTWFTSNRYALPITIKSPDEDVLQPAQRNYIRDYFNSVEAEFPHEDSYTSVPGEGYHRVFDTKSFIKHMLVNEIAANTDAYWSTYMYKRRNDPVIYTGPVWDFDLGFNNDNRTYPVQNVTRNSWLWNSNVSSGAGSMRYFAQRVLVKDRNTVQEIKDIWNRARHNGMTTSWFQGLCDKYAADMNASQKLNFMRWPILTQNVHMNPWIDYSHATYASEVQRVKVFFGANMPNLDRLAGYDPDWVDPNPEENDPDSGIMTPEVTSHCVIFALDGRMVFSGDIDSEMPQLAPGVYIIRRANATRKIIVR